MKMEQTGCPEMFAYKIQTPGNYPEESVQKIKLILWHSLSMTLWGVLSRSRQWFGVSLLSHLQIQQEHKNSKHSHELRDLMMIH
jgi:hypothetical protein